MSRRYGRLCRCAACHILCVRACLARMLRLMGICGPGVRLAALCSDTPRRTRRGGGRGGGERWARHCLGCHVQV